MYTELVLLLEWDWVEVWVDIRDFKTQERGRREKKPGSKMTSESFSAHNQKLDVLSSCRRRT